MAELARIISYPTSVSGITVLLKMPKTINKSSQIYFVTTKGMFQIEYTKTPPV